MTEPGAASTSTPTAAVSGSVPAPTAGVSRRPRRANVDFRSGLPRPRWRGRIHAGSVAAAPFAVAWLIAAAQGTVLAVAAAVYGTSLLICHGVSATYHRLARSRWSQDLFRRLDHGAIFLLVAGTYTPVCLAVLDPRRAAVVLGVVWSAALAAATLKFTGRAPVLSNALYLVLGWVAVPLLPVIVARSGWLAGGGLVAGGVLYTAGAVLFYRKVPRLSPARFGFHELWHVFTVLAAAAHFAAVAALVR